MGLCNQVCLLMWKNWLIQKRRKLVTLFEILLPALFSFLITLIRGQVPPSEVTGFTYFDNETIILSSGYFPDDGIIGYVPVSNATTEVMLHVLQILVKNTRPDTPMTLKGFKTEEESVSYYLSDFKHMQHIVVFHGVTTKSTLMPKKVSFSIRPHNPGSTWRTDVAYPLFLQSMPQQRSRAYRDRGVLYLQSLVGEALARYWTDKDDGDSNYVGFEIYTRTLVYPPYYFDSLAAALRVFLPVFIVLSFMLSVVICTKNVVTEKEKKLKESMKLMGLTSTAYWLSWYLTLCVYLVPAMTLYTLMFTLSISSNGPVLYQSSASLFFVLLLVYGHALITSCFMISTLVNKSNLGAALAGLVFFASYMPSTYLFEQYEKTSRREKLLYCLLFNTAMSMAVNELGRNEASGEGATWSNFYDRPLDKYSISMFDCMIMMLVSSTIQMIITWYLDNVRPGEFGVPKPYNFCFMKSYWLGAGSKKEGSFEFDLPQNKYFEKEPAGRMSGIQICKLRKEFGNRVAVAGSSLNMYEGHITVLLGHNGAGKTTTMAMITGFTPPTSGTALVNGHDIRTNIDEVRKSLGLCPQHDILFDMVTVTEHFQFFSKMKGYSSPKLKQEILELATKVGLEGKLDTYSQNLSGGQKRKLSVGIALIGGSKVVILDEPSSGMDPSARRQTWSVLQEARQGRTILLTTHYMDEADLLGDRIAIMAEGVIKCCGTPLFLKKLYGAGYHLVVVTKPKCDIDMLTAVIQSVIPKASVETVVNTEVTYLLPDSESKKFANLFRLLDSEMARLKVSSYGTTATTMEEVFIKVGESGDSIMDLTTRYSRNTLGSISKGTDLVYLTVVHDSEDDAAQIADVVKDMFPTAETTTISKKIITFMLPGDDSGKVSDLSAILESNKDPLKIRTFSISSIPTIEPEEEDDASEVAENITANADASSTTFDFNTGFTKATGLALQISRLVAIFVKKALLTCRSRVITVVQLVLPGLFTLLIMLANSTSELELKEPPLTLNILPFGSTTIPYSSGVLQDENATSITNLYRRQFCTCHKMESLSLKNKETFDNATGELVKGLGRTYIRKLIIGMELIPPSAPDKLAAVAYYNNQPTHSEAISVNYLVNALLQHALNTSFTYKSAIAPLPQVQEGSIENRAEDTEDPRIGMSVAISLAFAMSFMTSLFVGPLIKERQTGAKHMQIMTGISPVTYWVPTFLWDFLNFLLPSLAIPVLFEVYKVKAYTMDGRSAVLLMVLAAYGWAVLAQMYTLQFLFTSPASGMVVVVMLSFLTSVPATIAVQIMNNPLLGTQNTARILDNVFTLAFPTYNLASCFINIDTNYQNTKSCLPLLKFCTTTPNGCCKGKCELENQCVRFEDDYLSMQPPGIAKYLIGMAIQGVIYFLIVLVIEYNVMKILRYAFTRADSPIESSEVTKEDSDVAAERKRITTTPLNVLTSKDSLVLVNLYKKYQTFIAVDHTCVGIPDQECFGLLGQNGAGKSTTFKMITGDIMLSGGNAYLKGFSIRSQIKKVQANMGYCPQFDPLIDVLTGRETMTMYARLRGIPGPSIHRVIVSLAEFIRLTDFLDDFSGNYSGGNKRKLSTAIALIGDPPFIMLDEPSSGMDPEARRSLWTVLSKVRASGRTLVLTSHSMEECDALCTRIAIMVKGKFVCLGSPQHLKSKFAQGYTLIMKLGTGNDGVFTPSQPIIDVVKKKLPGALVFDDHEGYIHFQVPDIKVKVADIFFAMEAIKEEFKLEDYSVHQTTLEQVFLSFTKPQLVPPEKTESKPRKCSLCGC